MRVPKSADVGSVQLLLAQCAYRDPMFGPVIHPRVDEFRSQMRTIRRWRESHGMTDVRELRSAEVKIRHREVQHRRSGEHRRSRLSAGVRFQYLTHAVTEQRQGLLSTR